MIRRVLGALLTICLILASCSPEAPAPKVQLPTAEIISSPTITESPTLFEASAPSPIPEPTLTPESPPTPEPTPIPTTAQRRPSVFVISWDGGRADLVYDLMAEGSLPHFAQLAALGLRAEYALSVDPPLTVPAQNSIATGSYPNHTGLVSNIIHNSNDSFYWYRQGYDELLDQAEPVWVTASRAGLKSAALFFTGATPAQPSQMADYTIGYGQSDAYSRQETVTLNPISEEWQGEHPPSYSPPLEGSITIPEVAQVYLYTVDSSDDTVANYDTVLLSTTRSLVAKSPRLKVGEWGDLVLESRNVSGADFLIQSFHQDKSPFQVTLFYSGVYHNIASPRQLLEELNKKFGFFPAGPDSYAVEHGWITPEDDLYLQDRQASWMAAVSAWVYTAYQPDLLYTWQDGFDTAGHSFMLKDPRQPNYSPENVQRQAGYFQRAVQTADQALATMLQAIDLKRTTVMLVADHGMAPAHTTVYVNTVLEKARLLALDRRDYVIVNQSKAIAFVSGGSVNVFINLTGREADGIVAPEEYPRLQAQIIGLLTSLIDPQSGEKVFQRVLPREDLASLHLDHPNSGDIFAQAYPGYNLDGWRGKSSIFEPTTLYGQHGYDSTLPEMHTLFIVAGAGASIPGRVISPVRIIDYAPTIAALLGFAPAPTVDGTPILVLTQDD
jgi:predicted AlkP superfamily pyrophosphatase or phosphodiesterase